MEDLPVLRKPKAVVEGSLPSLTPSGGNSHQQMAWDAPRVSGTFDCLLKQAHDAELAALVKESSACLMTQLVSSLGLYMDNNLAFACVYPCAIHTVVTTVGCKLMAPSLTTILMLPSMTLYTEQCLLPTYHQDWS